MKVSTIFRNFGKAVKKVIPVIGWILIWQFAAVYVKQEMLIASPVSVFIKLFELSLSPGFWQSIYFSLSRVIRGFLFAFFGGILSGALAYKFMPVKAFLNPAMSVIKASPVASYTIICLLFMPSKNLSVFISFMMALPIIYINVLQGLLNTDKKLLEMAQVFKISPFKKALYIYSSELMPFLLSASSLSLGLCWKSGIAAEVIGLPLGSIGEKLYQAKIFVDTKELFAWTIVIIALSFLFEKVFIELLKKLMEKIERL
ncbi:MAG: ABC transporter permease subunit [Lachnospiraceae bacterium]|jgi:NitT/TauT family transport system permease protein|nr:ABC transporter permease subunit [Lachnospiraceae bacterium]